MPPPPSLQPRPKTSQPSPTQMTRNEEHISPYFSGPATAERASSHVLERDKRPLPVLDDDKENLVRPVRRKTQEASQSKIARSYDKTMASCRSSKVSTNNAEIPSENSTGSENDHMHPTQQQAPTCSPEDDDVDLYLQVGKERNGFRTAKSFGRAVAERKKMKKL